MHRTWLDPRRPAKARVSRPRKALGRVHGLAVRFGEPDVSTTLLVGEGIETVLSLIGAWPDTPSRGAPLQGADLQGTAPLAAAALSAGSLGSFIPPPGLSRLLIAQDRDDEGQGAALRLQLRCTRLGIDSAVIVPQGNDFNDDLMTLGRQRLAQRLAPLAIRARTEKRCGFAELQGTNIPLSNKRTPT